MPFWSPAYLRLGELTKGFKPVTDKKLKLSLHLSPQSDPQRKGVTFSDKVLRVVQELSMVSLPCQSPAGLHRFGFQLSSKHLHPLGLHFPPPRNQISPELHSRSSVSFGNGRVGIRSEFGQRKPRTLFPGGYKRPEIKVPNLVLEVGAAEVLSGGDALDKVDLAVSRWVGIVVLDGGEGSGGGGKLYEAAVLLKSVVRDRAALMVMDRVDIAAAVNANGVVLSDQGLPTIVARNAMMDGKAETVMLPLVAKKVQTTMAALSASNSEGADFLLLSPNEDEDPVDLMSSLSRSIKVPVFVTCSLPDSGEKLLRSGASGLVVSLKELGRFSEGSITSLISTPLKATGVPINESEGARNFELWQSNDGSYREDRVVGIVEGREKKFVQKEKVVLLEAIDVIRKAAPLMEEVTLLTDAVAQLDELFLLVIVGEFNSGKSSVINALLGSRYMKEGVVPTTNEITFLKFSELDSGEQQGCERHPDGQYICYLPATILKEMNIVDTPGTNVILQRQQRLTEEFLPRADLLLFVISADRPLTESEVTFLRYTQQWRKKVVFVLNKSDLYQNATELEEAISFIKENTQKLLNTDQVTLYPVSARSALRAKLSASADIAEPVYEMNDSSSRINRFDELEKFLYSFLDGNTSMGIARMKLKLETPVAIADRLLTSCSALARQEGIRAEQDLASVDELVNSVKEYATRLEYEHASWKRQILSLIETTKSRVVNVILSTLKISNVDLAISYVFKGDKTISTPAALHLQNDIIGPAHLDAQRILGEYLSWLNSKNSRERNLFKESFEKKWPKILHDAADTEPHELLRVVDEHSMSAIGQFSASAASKLFEQEVQEVFLGTFGGVGSAGLSASLLTSVLPSTMEDLLALGLCSAGGYYAIASFSSRRRKLVDKVNRIAESLARELGEAMQKDLAKAISDLENFVAVTSKPYKNAAQRRIDEVLETQERISQVEKKLQALQIEIQNLHVS